MIKVISDEFQSSLARGLGGKNSHKFSLNIFMIQSLWLKKLWLKIMIHKLRNWLYLGLILMWLNISIWRNIWRSFNDIIFLCDDLFLLFNFVKCILIHIIYLIIVVVWLDSLSAQWEMCQSIIFQFMNGRFGIGKFFLSLFQFSFKRFFFLEVKL